MECSLYQRVECGFGHFSRNVSPMDFRAFQTKRPPKVNSTFHWSHPDRRL